jgi:hypothetical protein
VTSVETFRREVDDSTVARLAAAHRPDARAVALGVDLRADPNLVDDEGRVAVTLRRAAHPSAVRPGRQITFGSSLGRWRGTVVAWDLALDTADPLVVVDEVEPC